MSKYRFIILICLLFFSIAVAATNNDSIFAVCRVQCAANANLAQVAKQFIGTPYMAGTLDGDSVERLKIRLDAFDCVTFVETALALWRSNAKNYDEFAHELQHIRYRNGAIDGYASRLHYTTDWLDNNAQKGTLTDITRRLGGIARHKNTDFMSRHAEAYPALGDTAQLAAIRQIEAQINSRTHYFIPKNRVASIAAQIPEGAIIAITSTIDGLDCAHIGIATKRNGATHLLHASSSQKCVCISKKTLADYLESNKKFSGIIVAMPIK